MAWTFDATKRGYGNMWRSMAIKPGKDTELAVAAVNKILGLEAEYRDAFAGAGMPWYYGAAIHYRESSNDLRGCMVNGEKIVGTGQRTRLVPADRGPYATFKESVQDAATLKKWREIGPWSIERFLFTSEIWNGLGYVSKGVNAPFVWAGTNHEERGLYVADHVFDANTEDTRLGVAAIIKRLMEVRPDIAKEIVMETQADQTQPSPVTPPAPAAQPVESPALTLLNALLPLLMLLLKSKQQPAEPAPVVVAPPPTEPVLAKPSVQLGTAGLFLSTILQAFGFVGMPAGPGSTTAGTLATIIPAAIAGIGATGGFGTILKIGASLFGALANRSK